MILVNSENNCSATDSPFTGFFCFVLFWWWVEIIVVETSLAVQYRLVIQLMKGTRQGVCLVGIHSLLGRVKIRSIPLGHFSQRKATLIPYLKPSPLSFSFLSLSSACPWCKVNKPKGVKPYKQINEVYCPWPVLQNAFSPAAQPHFKKVRVFPSHYH